MYGRPQRHSVLFYARLGWLQRNHRYIHIYHTQITKRTPRRMQSSTGYYIHQSIISYPSFSSLSPLLDDLLPLRINLLVIDLPRGLALLPLRGFRRLHANSRRPSATDLLFSFFPANTAIIDFVSGGWKSVIAHSIIEWFVDDRMMTYCSRGRASINALCFSFRA